MLPLPFLSTFSSDCVLLLTSSCLPLFFSFGPVPRKKNFHSFEAIELHLEGLRCNNAIKADLEFKLNKSNQAFSLNRFLGEQHGCQLQKGKKERKEAEGTKKERKERQKK